MVLQNDNLSPNAFKRLVSCLSSCFANLLVSLIIPTVVLSVPITCGSAEAEVCSEDFEGNEKRVVAERRRVKHRTSLSLLRKKMAASGSPIRQTAVVCGQSHRLPGNQMAPLRC